MRNGENQEKKMTGQEKYEQLRQKHPIFYYRGWTQEETEKELHITYYFEVPGLAKFCPEWRFPKPDTLPFRISDETLLESCSELSEMIFSLGLVELISYWKTVCCPLVILEAGYLDEEQKAWWKEQYYYGLGEFFYTNKISLDPDGFLTLHNAKKVEKKTIQHDRRPLTGYFIPVGGGKDSAVTMELLREFQSESLCYMINGRGATMACAKVAGMKQEQIVLAKRTLAPEMLELNRQGYLNGHTPFSAIVAFSSILAAWLHGRKYVVLSNESSANESTVAGSTVNHQYSKSFKFEEDFHNYERRYIGSGVSYFSLLRPWSEYQIAAWFAGLPRYHNVFRSCNVGSKQDIWCGHCAKCLFVYLILSPFLRPERVREIFGRDMLEDEEMVPVLYQLVGETEEKPFECVGSREEVSRAVCETIYQMEQERLPLPLLFQYYKKTESYQQYRCEKEDTYHNPYWDYYEEENLVPEHLQERLRGIEWSEMRWKN